MSRKLSRADVVPLHHQRNALTDDGKAPARFFILLTFKNFYSYASFNQGLSEQEPEDAILLRQVLRQSENHQDDDLSRAHQTHGRAQYGLR